jgi:hypothetical protein
MPPPQLPDAALPEALQFRPWPPWDPVPWWILRFLDERVVRELAVVQLEAHRAVLDAQAKSIEKTIGVLKGGGR